MLFDVDGWGLEDRKVKVQKTKKAKNIKRDKEIEERKEKKLQEKIENDENIKKGKKDKKLGKKDHNKEDKEDKETSEEDFKDKEVIQSEAPPPLIASSSLTPLQRKMLNKLNGSRFRWINEQLYTTTSDKALEMISKQPELYEEYHTGFASQVENWPENPVDIMIREIVYRGITKNINAPGGFRSGEGDWDKDDKRIVVADMGCGEANLAKEINKFSKKFNNSKSSKDTLKLFKKKYGNGKDIMSKIKKFKCEVHSFDLKKINEFITVADIKNVPLNDESCSVVIFCLSLMGTNFLDFIEEANRILVKGGDLWITEIKSRLSDSKSSEFIKAIESLGFKLKVMDDKNKMFTRFEFYKPITSKSHASIEAVRGDKAEGKWLLKPCIYKRR